MAQKRMFDKAIIDTDNFLNVSLTAKALYFLLGMEADDEGFVSPNRVIRLYGGEVGDLKNLVDTGLVIPFKSGVVVITDWHTNNWLDRRRTKPTRYQEEKSQLSLVPIELNGGFTNDKKYVLSTGLATAQPEENRIEENRIEEKDTKAGKKVYGEFKNVFLLDEEYKKLNTKMGEKGAKAFIENLSAYLASKKKKYHSHYATILNWSRRNSDGSKKMYVV